MSNITMPCWLKITLALLLVLACASCQGFANRSNQLEANPEKAAELYLRMGQQYWQQGNVQRAGERLQRAVALAPDWGEAALVWADWQAQYGDAQQAIQSYRNTLQLLGDDGVVHNRLAVLYCRLNQLAQANAAFADAVTARANPQPATAYTNQALCYVTTADRQTNAISGSMSEKAEWYRIARERLTLALQANSQHAPALLLAAQLAWQQSAALTGAVDLEKQMQAAEYWQRYTQLVSISSMPASALFLGQAFARWKQDWAAYAAYQQAANSQQP